MIKQHAKDTIKYWAMMQDNKTLIAYHRILRRQSTYQIDAAGRALLAAIGEELDNRNIGTWYEPGTCNQSS